MRLTYNDGQYMLLIIRKYVLLIIASSTMYELAAGHVIASAAKQSQFSQLLNINGIASLRSQ